MRIPLALLVVLLAVHGQALAQMYAVDIEGVVFDRTLTVAEMRDIQKLPAKDPTSGRPLDFEQKRLEFLREKAHELFSHKCTLVVGTSEIASQYLRADDMKFEAHIRVMEADEQKCKLDVHLGVAYAIKDHMVVASTITHPLSIRLGTNSQISHTSGHSRNAAGRVMSYDHTLKLRVRPATDDDLALKTVPANFGADLIKKRIAPARPGMLITR